MRPFPRIAAVTAMLFLAGSSQAQIGGGFGQRHAVGFHVRTGPYNSLTYVAGSYGFGFGPIYGPVPSWYYGWPGVPLVPNPFTVQPAVPPVVIQNIIQAPGVAAPVPERRAFVPPEFDAPAAKPAPKPAKPAARAVAPVLPPDPPKPPPALVGRADADRVAEAGRKAFTDGQYGRALELFRRAAEVTPNEPSAHYLIAQAEFALGKYREAVAAITAGMALRADWPDARLVARDLYWKKPELFDEHLKALRHAVAAFPDDAGLLFLLGHQLWFDGKRDEARPLFQKAAALGKGQTPAEAFLAK
jgi:hypothetical protein